MNKILLLLSLLLFQISIGFTQIQLNDDATISLITCAPGDDLYNTFGHSAVRVQDAAQGLDIVFNYGTFSFGGSTFADQVNFGVTFARGKLLYHLSVSDFNSFVSSYKYQQRSVWEQELGLTQENKQTLFDILYENQKEENKYYKYDFFYDNCSSRIRDILRGALGNDVAFYKDEDIKANSGVTFMNMIDPYIEKSPWTKWGIYVLLGLPANEDASKEEQMFLPDYLMDGFANAQVNQDGWKPLVGKTNTIYEAIRAPVTVTFYKTPIFIFSVLFLIIAYLSYRNYKFDKHYFVIDYIMFAYTGLIGLLLLFMWFGTDHITTKVNLNLLWAIPFNIVVLFFLKKKLSYKYLLVVLGITFLLLVSWMFLPQKMHIAFIPVVGIMLVRYLKLISWHRLKLSNVSSSN